MRKTTYELVSINNESINLDSNNYILNQMDIEPIKVNLSSYSNNGQAGTTITNRKYEDRQVAITGYIFANSKTEMRVLKSALQRVVNPMKPFYLDAYTHESQKEAVNYINYESYSDFYRLELNAITTIQYSKQWFEHNEYITKFIIEAVAAQPFWQPRDSIIKEFAGWQKDFHFPYVNEKGKKFTFGQQRTDKIISIENNGDVAVGLTVYFRAIGGTVKNPLIVNTDTKEQIKVNTTINNGEEVIVSTGYGKKEAYNANTGANLLTSIDSKSTFIQLPLGVSPYKWDYDVSGSTGTLECIVEYTPLYAEV